MKIVIDIDDNIYTRLFDNGIPTDLTTAVNDTIDIKTAIRNGTPLPEHHGRLIDADKMIADLLTVDPRYKEMIDWSCQVIKAQPTIVEGRDA